MRWKFLAYLACIQCDRTDLWLNSSENGNIFCEGQRIAADFSRVGEKTVPVENTPARKARHWQPFLATKREILQITHWLAGDAVVIATVSAQIPCKQGILQGILRFWLPRDGIIGQRSLPCSDFLRIPYVDQQGNVTDGSGNSVAGNSEW